MPLTRLTCHAGGRRFESGRSRLAEARSWSGLRRSGAAQQLRDDLARLLAALGGDLLEPLGVVALDSDEDRQPCVGIPLMDMRSARGCAR